MTPAPTTRADARRFGPADAIGFLMGQRRGRGSGGGNAWMVTFTDLIALLIAFFVLIFSMSQVEPRRWDGLVRALSRDLNTVEATESRRPVLEFQVPDETRRPGIDLDYLETLLRDQLAENATLAQARLLRRSDHVALALPALSTTESGALASDARNEAVIHALGGLLRNLDNRVEIVSRVDADASGDAPIERLTRALARGLDVSARLRAAGYGGALVTTGVGDARPDAETARNQTPNTDLPAERIEIVIRGRAGDGG